MVRCTMPFSLDRIGGYASPRAALFGGLKAALGVPALVLGASYLGFGALVRESNLAMWHGLLSTATSFALPGQIALVELYALGSTLAVIALAVALSGMRLLPMTMTLLPYLRAPGTPRWHYYLAAHFVAVTGWAVSLRVVPHLPLAQRLPFFVGFTIVLWVTTLSCTAVGYLLPGALPDRLALALLFINPIYFLLMFAVDFGHRARLLAFLFGGVLGPLFFLWSPDWHLLLAGLVGGTAAFFLGGGPPPRRSSSGRAGGLGPRR